MEINVNSATILQAHELKLATTITAEVISSKEKEDPFIKAFIEGIEKEREQQLKEKIEQEKRDLNNLIDAFTSLDSNEYLKLLASDECLNLLNRIKIFSKKLEKMGF